MATNTRQAVVSFRQYGIFNSDGELTRFTDFPSSVQIPKGTGVLLVEGGQAGDNPPGSYQGFKFVFQSSQASGWTTRLLCCLVNGSVAVGTSVDRIKEVAIKKDITPAVRTTSSGTFYDVTFNDLGIPFKSTSSSTPISIYIENPSIQTLTITITGPNSAYIVTQGDDTAPTYNVTGPIGQTFEFGDTVNLAWTRSSMPSNSPEITTLIQYSNDNGDNWKTLKIGTGMPTGYSVNAGAFGVGAVVWRVQGDTYFSDWGTRSGGNFTVKPPLSVATPTSPRSGEYRSEKSEITLEWKASNPGTLYSPDKTDIQWKTENGSWTDLATVTDGGRSYPVPANTFPHEVIYWRVRAYNQDDLPGDWSEAINFTTIDANTNAYPTSPISGAKRDETTAILFTWNIYNNFGNSPTGADLEWNLGGGAWQTLGHVDGSSKQFTAPANTFPAGTIYWRVRAYNQDGVAGSWYNLNAVFSTIDTPSVATALSPSGTVEDADAGIDLEFRIDNQSGSNPTGVDLQYSVDNSTWITLASYSDPVYQGKNTYVARRGTLPPGTIYWRARSYNRNHVAGNWSSPLSFVARAAPTMQDIGITAKPWATINWQSDDQLTYEVFVDGDSLGSFFGGERQYQLPDYLSDGDHTVGVRVLGSFSLWSQILETTVHIENSPALQLVLEAMTDIDTELVWTGGDGDFFVYRDGLMIAHTNEHSFTDRTSLGSHEYRVIERLASGDYNASETLTQTPSVPYQHIAALAGGDWIAIHHTLKSQAEPSYQESQETAFNYLSGNDYPTASIGNHRTDVGQYSAVFLYTEEAENRAFLALRGKPVILKTADGEVMIGVLNAWERHPKSTREKKLYTAYTFSIQRIGWEDFIDDTL